MQTKTRWQLGLAALLVVGALGWAFAPRPMLVELGELRQGRFEAVIEEEGKTRVLERYTVTAPLAGRWLRPSLKEGDALLRGALLGQFQPAAAPLLDVRSQAELQAREQAAEAAQGRARARVAGAEAALDRARRQLARSDQLQQQGFVSPALREDEAAQLELARQDLAAAQAEAQVASYELAQARAARHWQGQGGGQVLPLSSPTQGQVLRVLQGSEAVLAAGTPLMELGDVAQLELVAELLSSDALRVSPGQPVTVERWGGDTPLKAVVRRVEPGGFTKVSALGVEEQRVRVLMALQSPPTERVALGDGYRVSVRITTKAVEGAQLLPVSAVFPRAGAPAAEPQHACYVQEGGRARLVPVTLRERSGAWAWVQTDLKPGTPVVIYPPAGLTDGMRIRAS